MFHRVKSEAEKPQAAQSAPVKSEQQAPQAKPASAPIAAPAMKETANNNETSAPQTPSPIAEPAGYKIVTDTTPQQPHTQLKETLMSDNTENQNKDDHTLGTKAVDIPSSAYNAAPARSAYPGSSYAASGYGVPSSSPASTSSAASSDDRRLVIGQGITMSGEIEHCDMLLVEGTIEAALKGAKLLEISESGTFYGTVEIDAAEISGRFEGELTVNGRLTVYSTGVITGSISYKELQIEAGAVIDGKLTPLKQSGVSTSTRPLVKKEKTAKEAAALAKAKEIKEQGSAANNDEGELFSATAAAE